jgi:hypothetical protein
LRFSVVNDVQNGAPVGPLQCKFDFPTHVLRDVGGQLAEDQLRRLKVASRLPTLA